MPAASDPRNRRLIALTGFMGAGKTTVGRALARQMGWHFTDLDTRIEQDAGLDIPALFERLGEPQFREIERNVLGQALGESRDRHRGTVLALGGGTFVQPASIELLRLADAAVVWLECPLETLLARCATVTNRPLFRDETGFRMLYAARLPYYQSAAYRVDSSAEPQRVAAQILALGILEQVKV